MAGDRLHGVQTFILEVKEDDENQDEHVRLDQVTVSFRRFVHSKKDVREACEQ